MGQPLYYQKIFFLICMKVYYIFPVFSQNWYKIRAQILGFILIYILAKRGSTLFMNNGHPTKYFSQNSTL